MLRFVLRWSDEDGKEIVTSSDVEVCQPSPQLTVLKATGLWADETLWTVVHNAEGVRIIRSDWGASHGEARGDALDELKPDGRLERAMREDLPADGSRIDPEIIAQWIAMLEEIECVGVKKSLPKSRAWANLLSVVPKTLEGQC